MKRVSLLIKSKKYPGQSFVGHALLHEFNPKLLSFFTSQKFPVDDELEVGLDFFGTQAQMKILMTNIHEQISSGRVMNFRPDEENQFPVRKFYRCYGQITALEGLLPGMTAAPVAEAAPKDAMITPAAEGSPTEAAGVVEAVAAAPEAPVADVTPITQAADSIVSGSNKPADSEDMAAKLAALDEKKAA